MLWMSLGNPNSISATLDEEHCGHDGRPMLMGYFLANVQALAPLGRGGNETGWRVKVMESLADRAAPAVVQERLVRFLYTDGHL